MSRTAETEVDAFADWWDTFIPTGTPVEKSGPHIGDEPKMFETFGPDLEFVLETYRQTPNNVWTVLDCDGDLYISAGFHHVNRMGYFITEAPWTEAQFSQDIPVD